MDGPPAVSTTTARELIIAWLHLAVLWTFAIAQPLFGVLSDSPEFFVARGNTTADIVLFAIGVTLLPPTILVVIEALFGRLPRVRRALHLSFVAALTAALALQLFDDLVGGSSTVLLIAAAIIGIALAIAYARTRPVPELLTILSPAPFVFLAIFLLISPVSKLVLPQEGAEAAESDVRSKTPVVMVVMDEFDPNMLMNSRQRIDRTRYPNFAALAQKSTWYRNATTAAVATTDAVPALLSSTKPREDALPVGADYPDNLFTLLGESHRLRVQETTTELCPERLCGARRRDDMSKRLGSLAEDLGVVSMHVLLPEGLRSGLPAVDRTFADFRGGGRDDTPSAKATAEKDVLSEFRGSRIRTVDRLVDGIAARPGKPGFHFLHAAFPHVPWQYLPTGQQLPVGRSGHTGARDRAVVRRSVPTQARDAAPSVAGRPHGPIGRSDSREAA